MAAPTTQPAAPVVGAAGPAIHIHCPPSVYRRRITFCPTCDQRRRFVGLVAVWYPTLWTCCGCGDSWDGETGERMSRPFARAWRKDVIRRARNNWVSGLNAIEVSSWLSRQLDAEEAA